MLNRYYQTGLLVGAVMAEWALDQYKKRAREKWSQITTPFAIIALSRNGEAVAASPQTVKEKASDLYGRLASNPVETVYLAYFDRNVPAGEDALIDEAFFQPTDIVRETIKETVRTEKVPTPVKAGLGLAAILGILALIAKH